jgi:DNA mismatch endonuclease, patch repair protein
MRRIKSKDTKPEMILRRALHARGLRYRIHVKALAGRPDIVFVRRRVAVFVHGCFWHRHAGCREASIPRSRAEYWEFKLNRNATRDRECIRELEEAGYRVIILWECEIERDVANVTDIVNSALALAP